MQHDAYSPPLFNRIRSPGLLVTPAGILLALHSSRITTGCNGRSLSRGYRAVRWIRADPWRKARVWRALPSTCLSILPSLRPRQAAMPRSIAPPPSPRRRGGRSTRPGWRKRFAEWLRSGWRRIEPILNFIFPVVGFALMLLATCSGPSTYWFALVDQLAFGGRGYCPQYDSP